MKKLGFKNLKNLFLIVIFSWVMVACYEELGDSSGGVYSNDPLLLYSSAQIVCDHPHCQQDCFDANCTLQHCWRICEIANCKHTNHCSQSGEHHRGNCKQNNNHGVCGHNNNGHKNGHHK